MRIILGHPDQGLPPPRALAKILGTDDIEAILLELDCDMDTDDIPAKCGVCGGEHAECSGKILLV